VYSKYTSHTEVPLSLSVLSGTTQPGFAAASHPSHQSENKWLMEERPAGHDWVCKGISRLSCDRGVLGFWLVFRRPG